MDPGPSRARFLRNVAWNWLGVAVSLVSGFVVSPFIIRSAGHEGYGIWALVFSLIEYYWLVDLGFRSATVKYSAHYRATGEPERINEIVNTGLLYYSALALALLGATIVLSRHAGRFFQISAAWQGTFSTLIVIAGVSWALGSVFNVFNACLEGFQRFDLSSRIWIVTTGVRSAGILLLLALGRGLTALAVMVVASQALGYALSYAAFRRVFPGARFSLKLAGLPALRRMAGYGVHTFLATVAGRLLNETVTVLIGHFRPAAFAGYYNLPVRLLQYSAEAVARVGLVTSPRTAELAAKGDLDSVAKLGVYVNRYCLALFLPVAILLWVYGRELIQVWIGPEFAAQSAPLLPVLVLATAVATAGQFNSGSILYGLGKHSDYARGLLAEALLSFAALLAIIPRYGILGAAWVTSVLMILNRGLFAAWLVSRSLGKSYTGYVRSVYVRPAAAALPVLALMLLMKKHLLAGRSWAELFLAASFAAASYFALAFFVCLTGEHRSLLIGWAGRRLGRRPRIGSAAQSL